MAYQNYVWRQSLNDAQDSVCGLSQILWTSTSLFFDRNFLNDIKAVYEQLKSSLMNGVDCTITEVQFRMLRTILMVLEAKLLNQQINEETSEIAKSIHELLDVNINKT